MKNLYEEIDLYDFGRRAILAAKQTLASRISDLKKNVLAKKYGDRVARSSVQKYTRYGKKKFCYWMKKAMN